MLFVGAPTDAERTALREGVARVTISPSYPTALEALAKSRPALVLLDDRLAWSDLAAAQSFLSACRGRAATSLLVAAEAPAELFEAAEQAGVRDCIVRPLAAQHLADRVAHVTSKQPLSLTSPRRASRSVLVAGSAEAQRHLLAELLLDCGYLVAEATGAGPVPETEAVVVVDDDGLEAEAALARIVAGRARPPRIVRVVSGPPAGAQNVLERGTRLPEVVRKLDQLLERAPYEIGIERRAPFFFPIDFREAGGATPGPWRTGYSYAISPSAVFVRTLAPFRAGAALEARLRVTTTREQFPITGMVAWANGVGHDPRLQASTGMALQFLGPPISARLAELIRVCSSEAMVA